MNSFGTILIVRTGAIGDVVHTTNLFHAIKKAYPDVIIHYLTSPHIKPLLQEDKSLEKVLEIDPEFKLFSSYTKELASNLRREKYDLVINLQPSFKIRVLVILAGIKKRVNYKKDFKFHAVSNFFQTGLKVFPDIKEEKELSLYLRKDCIKKAKALLCKYKRPFIVINAGGMFSKRQGRAYPVDKWLETGNKLQEKLNGTVILTGINEDKKFLEPLNNIKNSVNLTGELSLEESCAVISQADCMISGDSGPLHIATAFGVKSIGLYGSMPVNRTGCYCSGINIVSKKDCVPCNKRTCRYLKNKKDIIYAPCMEEIDPVAIIEAISAF